VVSPLIGLGSYAYNNLPKVVSPLIGLGSYAYNNLPSLRDSSTNSSSLSAGLGDAKDNSQNLEDPGNKEKTLLKSSKIDSDKQTSSSQSGNKKESIKRKTIEPIIKDK
jgi:hypothetical protein